MELTIFVLFFLFCGVTSQEKRCERVTIPMCKNIGYNYTSMPNRFHHANQEEAGYMLYQFLPLIETRCSDDLVFFLCSLYAPVCMEDYPRQLTPCFSVCVRVRSGCGSIMRKYGFSWPEQMRCGHFPKYGDPDQLCMDSKEGDMNEKSDYVPKTKTETKAARKRASQKTANSKLKNKHDLHSPFEKISHVKAESECKCKCRQPTDFLDYEKYEQHGHKIAEEIPECINPCKNPFFNENQWNFTTYWVGVWAVFSCIAASFTVLTFIMDENRFNYPERPVIFLSACYVMISLGYLFPFGLGHETVACDGHIAFNQKKSEIPSPACTIDFLFIYFFTMASSLWWVILGFTWFLAASLKWSSEAIAGYSPYYHCVAWSIPMLKSIIVLWIGAIDGDPVSGVCSVGNQNLHYLDWFMIIPLCFYSLLGAVFLTIGFSSLINIRSIVRKQATAEIDELEKLICKICVFSILYLIPTTIYILCLFYEQYYRESWTQYHNCPCEKNKAEPHYVIFMLKYCMILIISFISVYWIASRETLKSWYCLFCSCASKQNDSRSERAELPAIQNFRNNIFELQTIA